MKNFKFLFFIFSLIVCEDNLITLEDEIISEADISIQTACENIKNPTSANDCVIATLEWDFRCCYAYVKNGRQKAKEHCKYLKDKASEIKSYVKSLKDETNLNYVINCEGNFIAKNVYMAFLIILLIL